VSVTDARDLARTVRGRTRRELLVLRDGRAVASTVPGVRSAPRGSAGFEAADGEYRGRRENVGRAEELVVFTDASEVNDAISRNRLLVIALLLAFLVLALASTVFVSRALQAQIGQFLEAARRLAGGRFGDPVPVAGDDEFAQLGREFNSMSEQLEGQIEEVQRKHRELETAIRRVGEASAAGLDRQGIFELAVQNAVQACEAEGGRGVPADLTPLKGATAGAQDADLVAALEAAERLALEAQEEAGRRGAQTVERNGVHAIALSLRAQLGTRATAQHLGVISLARRARVFSADESDLLDYLAGQAVISIENADLHEMVQRQAITDDLTGLSNVRRMHEALDREFERGRRFNTPVGLVLLDLDDFKVVNDTYGHQQGDEVLSEVAGVLRELSRDIDEPARYGGEELAVVLPQTEIEGAANLAERMREAIEALRIPRLDGEGDLRVTASFGVASVPSSASDKGSLVAAADAALYRAKRGGKNRVERAEAVTA
jgi:diguanylate cyclase (GGDEF)-like protein